MLRLIYMVLDFLNTIYPYAFILFGLVGVAMGINRALKSQEEENKVLHTLGVISGLLLFAILVLVVYNDKTNSSSNLITNYSVFFAFLFSLSIVARPLRKFPFAFIIASVIAMVVFYLVMSSAGDVTILGSLSLKWIVIGVVVLFLFILIIGYFQEKILDGLLVVVGWAPILTLLALAVLAQGITLLLKYPDYRGLFGYLPFNN